MRVTQQGKYLVWALSSLGLAMTVLLVERFWVTDNERIERVVYDLRRAVMTSDAEAVLKHLTPDVQYVQHGTALPGEATRELIRNQPVQRDVRLRLYPRTSDQRGTPDPSRQGRVSDLRQGTVAYAAGRLQRGDRRLYVVAGVSGDRSGQLEGQPDHARFGTRGHSKRQSAAPNHVSRAGARRWRSHRSGRRSWRRGTV